MNILNKPFFDKRKSQLAIRCHYISHFFAPRKNKPCSFCASYLDIYIAPLSNLILPQVLYKCLVMLQYARSIPDIFKITLDKIYYY